MMPLAHKHTGVVLVELAQSKLVAFIVESVLNVTPLLRWVVSILLKDYSIPVERLAVIIRAPYHDNPLNVMAMTSVLVFH